MVIYTGSLIKSYSKLKNIQIKHLRKTNIIAEVILNKEPKVITI